jgi:hypothetical protein
MSRNWFEPWNTQDELNAKMIEDAKRRKGEAA